MARSQSSPNSIPDLTLDVEGCDTLAAPSLAQIAAACEGLSPDEGCGFLILERNGKDYAQVAGGDGDYTVEWREHPGPQGDSFAHFKAGRSGASTLQEVSIATTCVPVEVFENERLTLAEAQELLAAFAAGKPRPKSYAWRDLSEMFQ